MASDDAVTKAVDELIAKFGPLARETAEKRAEALAREGRWPEHALALRVLSAVEGRLGGGGGMHRAVWLLLAPVLLTATPVAAEDYVVRDAQGRRLGTVEEGIGSDLVRRDKSGRRIGTVEDGIGDQLFIRDRDGRRTGTVEPGVGGDLIVRDRSGKREQVLEPRADGGYVVRDTQGRRIGTIEKR